MGEAAGDPTQAPPSNGPIPLVPCVVGLEAAVAGDEAVTGAKAANLARCATASLRVIPGFVLTTEGARRGLADAEVVEDLRRHWQSAGGDGSVFVVRSSSTIEDAGLSSMAGQFTSVLDVRGWDGLLAAVADVLASGLAVLDEGGEAQPMAVLVQRQLDAALSGVLFGVDPVTGDRDHLALDVVTGRPDRLVGGEVIADHHVLTRRGAVVHSPADARVLPAALRRELARIAFQGLVNFQAAQDMEWAVDQENTLWVLQSRPVTAITPVRPGPLMGPGPVAETFPVPLSELEVDLWLAPLREGILRALSLTGAASDTDLRASPVLHTYGGRAAVDLELLGIAQGGRSFMERFGPAALARHLAVAWRVGRTRVALPALGEALISEVDDHLSQIPPLDELDPGRLVDLVERTRSELTVVHTAEVLSGMLLSGQEPAPAAGLVALDALAAGRARGLDDPDIVAEYPVVLALSAPTTAAAPSLPEAGELGRTESPDSVDGSGSEAADTRDPAPPADVEDLGLRDGLRLRTRWLQELAGRAAVELADRSAVVESVAGAPETDGLPVDQLARHLRWEELRQVAEGDQAPAGLAERTRRRAGPPLPAAFRVTDDGRILAEHRGGPPVGSGDAVGEPAGGGRVVGTTCHRVTGADGPPGAWVLVTDHLVPELAPLLTSVCGLVSETGSPLSHLAILARENGVATVVGVPDARRRYPTGLRVVVDGLTGEIAVLDGRADTPPAEKRGVVADMDAERTGS